MGRHRPSHFQYQEEATLSQLRAVVKVNFFANQLLSCNNFAYIVFVTE